jgi:hypothetical protein
MSFGVPAQVDAADPMTTCQELFPYHASYQDFSPAMCTTAVFLPLTDPAQAAVDLGCTHTVSVTFGNNLSYRSCACGNACWCPQVPWNPVHNAQAIARIYRLGQKRPTYVYRLLYKNTMVSHTSCMTRAWIGSDQLCTLASYYILPASYSVVAASSL